MQRQRGQHPAGDTGFHAHRKGDKQSNRHSREVRHAVIPGAAQNGEIHQRQYRHDNGCRQRRLGQVGEIGGEKQCREADTQRGQHAGGRRCGTGIKIDDGARKTAGDRITAGHRCSNIRCPEPDQLLIGHNALPSTRGQRVTHRDRLDKTDNGNEQRRNRQLAPRRIQKRRQIKAR